MKGHTIKSNARRAARKAGLDPDTLIFAQDADGLWIWTEPAPEPTALTGKMAMAAAMVRDPDGATLAEVAAATGWQMHTARGRLSELATKHKLPIETVLIEGRGRVYRVPAISTAALDATPTREAMHRALPDA